MEGFLLELLDASHQDAVVVKAPVTPRSDVDVCVSEKGRKRIIQSLQERLCGTGIYLHNMSIKKVSLSLDLVFFDPTHDLYKLTLDIRTYIGNWPHQMLFDFDTACNISEIRDGVRFLDGPAQYIYLSQHLLFHKPGGFEKYRAVLDSFHPDVETLASHCRMVKSSPIRIFKDRMLKGDLQSLRFSESLKVWWFYLRHAFLIAGNLTRYSFLKKGNPAKLFV